MKALLPLPTGLKVKLYDGPKLLAEAPVDNSGAFRLTSDLPKGRYLLRVTNTRLHGETDVSADSYEIKGVIIPLE